MTNIRNFLFVAILLSGVLLSSCKEDLSVEIPHFGENRDGSMILKQIDTLIIDSAMFSFWGRWTTDGQSLLYLDRNEDHVPIRVFDMNGIYHDSFLAKGRGPNEVIHPMVSLKFTKEGEIFAIDGDGNMYKLNNEKQIVLRNNYWHEVKKMAKYISGINNHDEIPELAIILISGLEHFNNNGVVFGDYLIIPFSVDDVNISAYNPNNGTKEHYKESFNMLAFDRDSLKPVKVFAHYPSTYQNRILANFKNTDIATNDTLLFINYNADPSLYVYDDKFELTGKFGVASKRINHNYPNVYSHKEHLETRAKHRKTYGYYRSIKYENGYIIRDYIGAGNTNNVQIYDSSYNLVLDTELPYKQFVPIGYIAPYHYAVVGENEDMDSYTILRYTIEVAK